ncbi:MAG: phage holin family protein [Clostridia bacterium]|nr:phage holin family protein [Clostridia bacterium]
MEKFWERVIEYIAALGGLVVGMFGGWTPGSRVLVILMAVDYFTGLGCALTGHSAKTESGHFWSKVAFLGLLKKGVIMLVILVAAQLDQVMGGGEGVTLFRSAAEFFYIASEGLSVVENAGLLGVPVPKGIRQALEVLRDKNDTENK